ncbi:glucose-6-phosphate isomerase [Candidatus Pelagibacter bacterium]|jgi:glucose-6-phosphate isomerase|nr:glucose-6-phosphate isomerase [Candidatus Pelagibacter bacterium]
MNLTKNIIFKNFNFIKKNLSIDKKIKINLKKLIVDESSLFSSMSKNYKYSYSKKIFKKIGKTNNSIRIFGIGGSILGIRAIYSFLIEKIKKEVEFIDNLKPLKNFSNKKKKYLNIIISKSGNTLETILNTTRYVKKNDKNLFITENTENTLRSLALKLQGEIIDHNNFIGGRYSVFSEVGMLPSTLIGLSENKFKQFNILIKNKNFFNNLVINTSSIIYFLKKKKFNSIVINYDETAEDLFRWYQQLVAESLGKDNMGIMPSISCMPKDNHSLLQLYLDGPRNNFFTFFNSIDKRSDKILNNLSINSKKLFKKKSYFEILKIQKKASENIFLKKKIPFRSFDIVKRSEESIGELFTFFILETILLGKYLKLNPFDQPSVELLKKETFNILSRN